MQLFLSKLIYTENASCVKGAFSYLCVFYADKSNCQNDKRQTTGIAKLLHFEKMDYKRHF
jgi:hypothetical protein